LKFHDMDHQPRGEAHPHNYILFNDDHAKQILNFLAKHENDVDAVIAHCEAGISRSAAVSKFVAYVYGIPFPESYMLYNKLVFRTLIELYNRAIYSPDEELDFNIPGVVGQEE